MKSTTENVVECVNAILKTLECSICLELLKNPVSTGCGHFFCRFCITETLQSNYRSPCPLCKKSFTRRGIQDAHQRRLILVAAKKLADVCETFADVKFFSKDCSQRDIEDGKTMKNLKSFEIQSNATEKTARTSIGRKRKSNEKEKDAALLEVNDSLPVLEKIGTNKTEVKPLQEVQYDSSNDEIIPTSNKRCRQSVEDSDSDDLPELSTLFQSDEHSIVKNSLVPPTLLATKTLDFETCKNLNNKQDNNNVSKNISSTAKINLQDSNSKLFGKNKSANQNANKFSKHQIKSCESKGLKIGRKRRFKAQNLKENNKNNPLRNKTNELNIDETTNNCINIAMNVIEEADKKIILTFQEKTEGNEETIKENEHTKDAALFSSPVTEVCNKSDLKIEGPKEKTKTPKSGKKHLLVSSFEEQKELTKQLKEAENFELTIESSKFSASKNTIPSTVLVNNSHSSKECYNLSEINLPESNEVEKTVHNVKKAAQSDEITDTAISVQTVASPETTKMELGSRSPGWSKVKQVGKDFRVKKFSKLSVEKNSSHSCSTEITSASSSESAETPKFKKLCISNVTKDVHNEKLAKDFEVTKSSQNSSLENEVVGDEQYINCVEQTSNGNKAVEMTTVSLELDKNDHTSLGKSIGEIDGQIEVNLLSTNNENCVDLEASNKADKNRKNNIVAMLSNDCSLLERHNLTSSVPTNNHILPSSQLSPISDGRIEILKSTHNNGSNTEIDNENENMCMNDEENMEVYNFETKDEQLKHPENEASCIDMLGKEISIQTLSDADLYNEVYNPSEININSNFQDQCNENGPCYVDSVLPCEKSFLEPDPKILPSKIKENKLFSKISKISKCEITASKSIFDKDESVYYTEHSQQTSQRLLEFCNDGQRKQNFFTGRVAALNAPFYNTSNTHGIVTKRNWYDQIEKFNPGKFGLGPQNTEKTKVLKRTCLTLDEIQEAFANSSISGTAETICSLPFSSGEFRLNVCVSEETLNISVLKVVDSEFAPNVVQTRYTVTEQNNQSSNCNTRVNSPVEILPSSNAASDSSQPDQDLSDGNSKMKNIFPYLNKYFPDSEPTDVKKSVLNDSEIIPFQGSNKSLNKNEDSNPVYLEKGTENNFHQNDNSPYKSYASISHLPSNKDENKEMKTNDGNVKMCVSMKGKTNADIPKLNDSSESLPPTQPYLGNKQNSTEGPKIVTENPVADIITPISEISENVSPSNKNVELTDNKLDGKFKTPNTADKTSQFLKRRESNGFVSDDEDCINFEELVSYQKTSVTSHGNLAINDSDGLSSDPAMAFATQLVAPLKNIASKMNTPGSSNNLKKQVKAKSSPEVFNAREKKSLQEFEELIFNLSKNSANDTSVSKPSRLSLKSKRSAKKFKRIKKFASDEDSDSNAEQSSKGELSSAKHSSTKEKMEDVQVTSAKTKGNELTCESLQEQSTLNSFLSEDITSKDPKQLAKEVEVLDKEIYSVVEQLKQYGREDVLKRVLEKLHTECEKESPVSEKSDKDMCMSDDSEDSTDIFSQTVPPTPPDNPNSKNDSVFKSSHYKHN